MSDTEERKKRRLQLWSVVRDDIESFDAWIQLLKTVQDEDDIEDINEVYHAFLTHYPLCFGYWNKWADITLAKCGIQNCEQVFRMAVKAFPNSIEIWIHYLTMFSNLNKDNKEVMTTFQCALNHCGDDYRSDPLWKLYLNWLQTRGLFKEVITVFDKMLQTPTYASKSYFYEFDAFLKNHSVYDVLCEQEYYKLCEEFDSIKQNQKGSNDVVKCLKERDDFIRNQVLNTRRMYHKKAVQESELRSKFEVNIKRPYFHVNPLDTLQLNNWGAYLNWAIENLEQTQTIKLFDRCMVVCALYEHFWLKYITYLRRNHCDSNIIKDVFRRSCLHLRKSLNLHFAWALFEEKQGNLQKTEEIIFQLEQRLPDLLQIVLFKINYYQRNGELKKVCDFYENAMLKFKMNVQIFSHLCIRYSMFTRLVLQNVDEAIALLYKAQNVFPQNINVYLQLIDIELSKKTVDVNKVLEVFDLAINHSVDVYSKSTMISRKFEFLQNIGSEIH
ncbi:pre-mRNA-processing factor 39-like isoform X3, partial [Leptotrombidium deliense]